MKSLPFIIGPTSLTVMTQGKAFTIGSQSPEYKIVLDAIVNKDWETVERHANKATAIKVFGGGKFEVRGNNVYYNDEPLHNYAVNKIIEFIEAGIDANPLCRFLERLMQNPSKRCVDELYAFLSHKNMPIDEDGCFYAYKAVRSDYLDKHSGTIKNFIGSVITMPRNQVDDNSACACSHGLHVGSLQYVKSFAGDGDKILVVKVAPEDVVSVPNSETTKLRCCKYIVIEEYTGPLPESTYESKCNTIDYTYEDEYDEEYDEDDYEDDDSDFDEYENQEIFIKFL